MIRANSRRRFISISAAAAGLAVVPFGRAASVEAKLVTWHGTMLGAAATMKIHHEDEREAQRLIAEALAKARRLERLFSLYREDSALVELNHTGILVDPAPELVELLLISRRHTELTGGLFDPTVQPLWELYADHFSRPDADPAGPPRAALQSALVRVGFDKLIIGGSRIAMPRGTRVTLNGIAQGYVTIRSSSSCCPRASLTAWSIWAKHARSDPGRMGCRGRLGSPILKWWAGPKPSFRSSIEPYRRPGLTDFASTRTAASTTCLIPQPAAARAATAA